MLSLSNTYQIGEVEDFILRAKNLNITENLEMEMEIKLDGLSISVIYEQGKLQRAVTRGDGVIGEDVTENVLQIETILKSFLKNWILKFEEKLSFLLQNLKH